MASSILSPSGAVVAAPSGVTNWPGGSSRPARRCRLPRHSQLVRLEISGETSKTEREAIKSVLTSYIDELDGFRVTGNIMDAVKTRVEVADGAEIDEPSLDTVTRQLRRLIEYYHPTLVNESGRS